MISSPPEWTTFKEAPINGNWFKKWLKSQFRYVDYPFLLTHRGFGGKNGLYVQGHVFRGMAMEKPRKHYSAWKNLIALVKMFMINTVEGANVSLKFEGKTYTTQTNAQGFFEFSIDHTALSQGWKSIEFQLLDELVEGQEEVKVTSEVMIACDFNHGLISDIDDTFLVSHVTQKLKKLYTLLTKNANTRKPVEGVVEFYKALYRGKEESWNPFFYVSSSEWNLYEFLVNFIQINELPKGVLQLKEIKDSFLDFFKSGYGTHDHKHKKIERIFEMYPNKKFILLGDNGQHDPRIYSEIAEVFPDNVKAVYIRGVKQSHWPRTEAYLDVIRQLDIPAFQFEHSHEAFEHAKKKGYIIP